VNFPDWVSSHLEVSARQEDGEWTVRCPWHGGVSMRVNVHKGLFLCNGCGVSGNHKVLVQSFGSEMAVLNRAEALKAKLGNLHSHETIRVYPKSWLARFASGKPHEYWSERGLSDEIVAEHMLGCDPATNSMTIPLWHLNGNPIGVIRRRLDPEAKPKYLYPSGFKLRTHVWNLHRHLASKQVALVEGSLDAVAMEDAGVPAIALLGSRLSDLQAKAIRQSGITEVVICTDCDAAGEKVMADVGMLGRIKVSVGLYGDWKGNDPGSLTPDERMQLFLDRLPLRMYLSSVSGE
jgi:DNA primase